MTSADHNDLVPAQEKLEWVTPKISLMGTGQTKGNKLGFQQTETYPMPISNLGPS
jgi:hypothetical protein